LLPLLLLAITALLLAACGTPSGPGDPGPAGDLTGAPFEGSEDSAGLDTRPSASPRQADGAPLALDGRRFLWIETKGVYCGAQCYGADGAYRALIERYRERGAIVDVARAEGVDDALLAGYELAWISLPANWDQPFDSEEGAALRRFVEAGGGLQILSDGLLSPNGNLDAVVGAFDMAVGVGPADYYAETVHPSFGDRLVLTAGAGAVEGGKAWAVDGYVDVPVGVMDLVGDGRVLVLGDANAFTGAGLRLPGGDNAVVSDIAVDWLLGFTRHDTIEAPLPAS
jgi:hypothetical protein